MHQCLLPVLLLTTVTFSSSNVLPILSINRVDAEPSLDDLDSDNILNTKHSNINPNIFYKVFIETSKENLRKKPQIFRPKYLEDNNKNKELFNEILDTEDNYDDKGFRKEQWHNYPRQLDRLSKNSDLYKQFEKIYLDTNGLEKLKWNEDPRDEIYKAVSDDALENLDSDVIAGPLLILKIRLAYLNDNLNSDDLKNNVIYTNLGPYESIRDNNKEDVRETNTVQGSDLASVVKVKRKGRNRNQDSSDNANEKKSVKKRIFSLWSRLQSLSHRGHELHHRRHMYAFYGLPEDGGGGALTAETRAILRPPGSPLRWG